ncbi:DUF6850 family outer membrane beta-barrel protein [Mucilaginibacter sp. PAMB04168]|uniref:DUF6850 family outer membrane beta-barrel protein n=1 Tax=Mucilaginibacter sp. PAMB04168 TaxID=3138567 RepID=UPI0031F6D566
MKHLFIGLCLLLISVAACAQAVTDSLYLYKQNFENLQFSKKAVSQLLVAPVERASQVQLKVSGESGGYRLSQVAQRTTLAEFSAEGIASLRKFKVSGYFSYQHRADDSLAWTQQGLPDEDRPYYFASAKAGPYQRDQFYMGGQLSFQLSPKHWFIGTGIDYLYNTATRSVDPRPDVKIFRIMIKPELIYRSNMHTIGVGVSWGTGYEDNGIAYASDSYRENTSDIYKPWITYFVTGYGSAYPQRLNLTINRNQRYKGLNVSYSGSIINWNIKAVAAYLLNEENNKSGLITSLNFDNIANYQADQLDAALLLSHQTNKLSQQVKLHIGLDDGSGFYNRIGATNYYVSHKKYSAEYNVMLNKFKHIVPGFTAGALYQDISRRDLSVYASNRYTWLQPSVGIALYNHINNQNDLSVKVSVLALVPLENNLIAPESTVTEFTKGVVYPDYYFYKSFSGGMMATLNYVSSNLLKGYRTGFGLQTGLNRKLSSPAVLLPAAFAPGTSRLSYALNLNLYF